MSLRPVLVVDDDLDVRQALCDALDAEGYPVASAKDGADALRHLAAQPAPALILLDWNMAPMDGGAFLAELRKLPGVPPPVVLLTADRQGEALARHQGCSGALKKPFQLDALFAIVEAYCS